MQRRRLLLALPAALALAVAPALALDGGDRTLNGQRVGAIVKATPPADLAKIYGAERVTAIKLNVEGEEYPGVSIHAGTADELQVAFTEDSKRIRFVRVIGRNWKSTLGVRLGTTLAELERINGGPFNFNGFGWDLGGIVLDQPRTKFAGGGLRVGLETTKRLPERETRAVWGDKAVSSRTPVLRRMDVRVYLLEVYFEE